MKRKLAVDVWQKIQPIIDAYRQYIDVADPGDGALYLKDIIPNTGFYFKCSEINNEGVYRIGLKPMSVSSNAPLLQDVKLDGLMAWLETWFKALEGYATVRTVYDDPILEKYTQEFFYDFEIIDQDADEVSFGVEQQLHIDAYLGKVLNLLDTFEEAATAEEKQELEEIKEECQGLKRQLTRLTKNQTMKRLSKVLARTRKFGLDLMKEALSEFKKEVLKHIAKEMIQGGGGFFSQIAGFLS